MGKAGRTLCVLGLLPFMAIARPAVGETVDVDCQADSNASVVKDPGPYMKSIKMHQPMPGEMKKDGMTEADVTSQKMQRDRCMFDVLLKEQRLMDEKTSP